MATFVEQMFYKLINMNKTLHNTMTQNYSVCHCHKQFV